MKILVDGGAGYIGSHMVKYLLAEGHSVTIFDNFSTGFHDALVGGELVQGDLADRVALSSLFSSHRFDAVMHFASFIAVGESVARPDLYYANNLVNTFNLLQAMREAGCPPFVFSSTAAVYGTPMMVPIPEEHPTQPINPYGHTKRMVEQMLDDYDHAFGQRSVCLRYFNAAGADPSGELGERHNPETHLIPLVLQAASGRRPSISVYGQDYDTPDGTCIRDYVHVWDLCAAHLLALKHLWSGGESRKFNLGNGNGYSVSEVIAAAERVTGKAISVDFGPRRPGDPPRLVADATRAKNELRWVPNYSDLETIVAHAWAWETKFRNGVRNA
jgi:UDP-glucose 4-epimerase